MPDQTTAFTPYRLDLTGLRAGQLVKCNGAFYDVQRVEVREELRSRDGNTGSPLGIETQIDVKLQYARWLKELGIDGPADVIELNEPGRIMINGCAYFALSFSRLLAYVGSTLNVPDVIDLQLVRIPFEDLEPDHA